MIKEKMIEFYNKNNCLSDFGDFKKNCSEYCVDFLTESEFYTSLHEIVFEKELTQYIVYDEKNETENIFYSLNFYNVVKYLNR